MQSLPEVVQLLFRELDRNNDGKVSLQKFEEGLQSVSVSEDLDMLKGLLYSLNLNDLIAHHLLEILRRRLGAGEQMTTDVVHGHVRREDITTVLQVGLQYYRLAGWIVCVCA